MRDKHCCGWGCLWKRRSDDHVNPSLSSCGPLGPAFQTESERTVIVKVTSQTQPLPFQGSSVGTPEAPHLGGQGSVSTRLVLRGAR